MYKLKNYMEDIVEITVENILERMDVCKCEKCKLDIMAISLNSLPPMYVVSEKGMLFSKTNEFKQQFNADVQSVVVKAAIKVGNKPQH